MWKIAKKVLLEPIPGKLLSGVPIRRLSLDGDKVKFPTPKVLSLWVSNEQIQSFSREDDGFVFSMSSSIKNYSPHMKVETSIWKPFMVTGCKIHTMTPSYSVSDKFVRVNQRFKIAGNSSGMFQLLCQNWKVKFNDQYYTRNDLLTVHYGKNRPNPWPLYNTVIPDEAQTFVPVAKGSKINILVDKLNQVIHQPNPDSAVNLIEEIFFDHSFTNLGTPLSVYRYGISRDMDASDFVFLTKKKYDQSIETRAIVFVPFRETCGYRYFSVNDPYSKAAVLTQGCNAVKLISRTLMPVRVADNCPATVSCISRIGDVTHYMIP